LQQAQHFGGTLPSCILDVAQSVPAGSADGATALLCTCRPGPAHRTFNRSKLGTIYRLSRGERDKLPPSARDARRCRR